MAPTSSDPHQIMVVLNSARRVALYRLVGEITMYMRSQLELQKDGDAYAEQEADEATLNLEHLEDPHAASNVSMLSKTAKTNASVSQKRTRPSPQLVELRKSSVAHLEDWRVDFQSALKKLGILVSRDDAQVLEERRKRNEKLAQMKAEAPAEGEDLLNFGDDPVANSVTQDTTKAVAALQAIYHPIPTRLTTIPVEDRKEVLSAVLILLLSTGNYSAYSRTFVTYLASAFELPLSYLVNEEKEIAKTMIQASAEAETAKADGQMSAEVEAQKRKESNKTSRFWKVGLASVAGAAVIGVTGGLAAPVVAGAIGGLMGSVGLGGLASFLGIFWMNGALVGTLFGAFGARMTVSSLSVFESCLRHLSMLTRYRVRWWTNTPERSKISASCL